MSKHLLIIASAMSVAFAGSVVLSTQANAGGAQAKTLTPPTVGKRRIVQPNPLAISDFSSSSPTKRKSKPNR